MTEIWWERWMTHQLNTNWCMRRSLRRRHFSTCLQRHSSLYETIWPFARAMIALKPDFIKKRTLSTNSIISCNAKFTLTLRLDIASHFHSSVRIRFQHCHAINNMVQQRCRICRKNEKFPRTTKIFSKNVPQGKNVFFKGNFFPSKEKKIFQKFPPDT